MTATRNQINSNFYQLVEADENGNIVAIQSQFLANVTTANANYANTAGHADTVEGWIKVPFTFSDVSPKLVAVIPSNKVVSLTEIIITEQFSDPNATLSAGTVANSGELINNTDVRPNILGTYQSLPGTLYMSETHVMLTINPGTSYTGSGMLIINY